MSSVAILHLAGCSKSASFRNPSPSYQVHNRLSGRLPVVLCNQFNDYSNLLSLLSSCTAGTPDFKLMLLKKPIILKIDFTNFINLIQTHSSSFLKELLHIKRNVTFSATNQLLSSLDASVVGLFCFCFFVFLT